MKPIQIHPASFLIGLLAATTLLSLLGMAAAQGQGQGQGQGDRVAGIPAPEDIKLIRHDKPFRVPRDKVFVVTGMGFDEAPPQSGSITIRFDQRRALFKRAGDDMTVPPPGIVARSGQTVNINANNSFITGYLADE